MIRRAAAASVIMMVAILPSSAWAGVIFGSDGDLGGGFRWDADPYTVSDLERSLDGALRYSLEGGSLVAFRDLFVWDVTPTEAEFGATIDQAFNAWKSDDPISGLGSDLNFIDDTANTTVVGNGFGTVNFTGAEIDLLASNAGHSGTSGTSFFLVSDNLTTLTSGTVDYAGSGSIIGADINLNNDAGAVYSLDFFGRLLTHEIGHALGLGDVEDSGFFGFIDDNFSAADPLGTLTNSWAHLVNPLDPSASAGLTQFFTASAAHFSTPGVDILMESFGLGISAGNPATNPVPLTADDYGTRQFLYPYLRVSVPEPSTISLSLLAIFSFFGFAQIKSRREIIRTEK